MPIYNYACAECNSHFKCYKNIKEFDSKEKCPNCNSENTKKLPSRNSFSLRGQGWYKDGYK